MMLPDPRALNPVRHGLFSQARLLPWEDGGERQRHAEAHISYFKPRNAVEQALVDVIDDASWKVKRFAFVETVLANLESGRARVQALPPQVQAMAAEVQRAELDVRILEKLAAMLVHRRRTRDMAPLAGIWIPLDSLLPLRTSVISLPVGKVADAIRTTIRDRKAFIEERRQELARHVEVARPDAEAAALEASMLRPDQHSRLLRHLIGLQNRHRAALADLATIRNLGTGEPRNVVGCTGTVGPCACRNKPDVGDGKTLEEP
jgi:hypothetical protein